MLPSSQVLLVSRSPRRLQLLEAAGFKVEVRPSDVDESWPEHRACIEDAVAGIARRKMTAVEVGARLSVSADTVVMIDGELLGKPQDAQQAWDTLQRLSDREHRVFTGFCVRQGQKERVGAVCTKVSFRDLSAKEIERYIDSGEPFDKAGAYGIQGNGGAFIDRISGSYTNVMGLPLKEVLEAMETVYA